MIGWPEARRISFAAASALPPESVALHDAIGRHLADDVDALCDLPHYASSAMDGWAVAGAGPWLLPGADVAWADGHAAPSGTLEPGHAAVILTGGVIPRGATAVLRSEHGRVDGSTLAVIDPVTAPRPGEHIRVEGEEARRGDTLIAAGTVINPIHIAVAAAGGHDELVVAPRPRVGLILTGDEVVESGIPGPGRVRDSFGPQLPEVIRMLGGRVIHSHRLLDELVPLVETIAGLDADVIITTGGTGHSGADHLRAALDRLGARYLIDGVAMRPGAPSVVARLADGRFVVGLPGNPLAAMIGLLTLAWPLLAGLQGAPEPALGSARLAVDLIGDARRTSLAPYALVGGAAVPSQWTGASMLRGLADAHGVLVCPPSGADAGTIVTVLPLPWSLT